MAAHRIRVQHRTVAGPVRAQQHGIEHGDDGEGVVPVDVEQVEQAEYGGYWRQQRGAECGFVVEQQAECADQFDELHESPEEQRVLQHAMERGRIRFAGDVHAEENGKHAVYRTEQIDDAQQIACDRFVEFKFHVIPLVSAVVAMGSFAAAAAIRVGSVGTADCTAPLRRRRSASRRTAGSWSREK